MLLHALRRHHAPASVKHVDMTVGEAERRVAKTLTHAPVSIEVGIGLGSQVISERNGMDGGIAFLRRGHTGAKIGQDRKELPEFFYE